MAYMLSRRGAAAALATLAGGCLAGCAAASAGPAAIGGLLRSDGQFVTSPDRCAISVLHDNYRIELPTPARTQSPVRTLTVSGGAGRPITIDVKGSLDGAPEVAATIAIDVAGRRTIHPVARSANAGFLIRHEGSLGPADETPITITAAVSGDVPAGQDALLSIESFDVAVGGGGSCK